MRKQAAQSFDKVRADHYAYKAANLAVLEETDSEETMPIKSHLHCCCSEWLAARMSGQQGLLLGSALPQSAADLFNGQ